MFLWEKRIKKWKEIQEDCDGGSDDDEDEDTKRNMNETKFFGLGEK